MGNKTLHLNSKLCAYLKRFSVKESNTQKKLREVTSTLELASMQVSEEQAEYLKFLVHSHQFKSILEIGTFTGYSALSMAEALPQNGHITCLEINDTWTKYSVPHWQKAGVDKNITLKIGKALETLTELKKNNVEPFDFVFIDADKTNYQAYYDISLSLIRQGGIIAIDNIFWDGRVVDETNDERQTKAIQAVTEYIYQDKRVKSCIIPIADGMMLAYKL